LAWRALFVFPIFLIGSLIEERGKIDDAPNHKGMLLNSVHALVFHGADLSIGVMTGYYLRLLFDKIPGYKAPIHFRGGAFEVFALTCFALATHDFFYYWLHRLQHTSKWLWAEHELHHTDEHVNVTTSWRHHWLDTVLQPLFILPPVLLLFNPVVGTVIWVIVLSKLMVYFVHLNSPIRFGWFNRVVSTPQTHRIHHSKLPEHMNKNFATALPLWDILFGTYYHPKEDEWPSIGVTGVTVTSLWQAIALPFVSWGKMFHEVRLVGDPTAAHDASGDVAACHDDAECVRGGGVTVDSA
jgi:sterol desaturase/sphingolipid hydroxylase (fatty acid hydroxylase superfamily)